MRILLSVLLITVVAMAETVTLEPINDTYTQDVPGCHGNKTNLILVNKPSCGQPDTRVSIMWDLSEYVGVDITSAVMKLDAYFQCGSGTGTSCNIYAITEEWDESWSGSHHAHETAGSGTYFFQGLGWHDIDVTDLVQRWVNGEIDNNGLVLRVVTIYPATKFYSSETVNSPELVLTYEGHALSANTWAGIKSTWAVD